MVGRPGVEPGFPARSYTGVVDYREVAVALMRLVPLVAEEDRETVRRAAGLAYSQHLATDPETAAFVADTLERLDRAERTGENPFPDARPGDEVMADLYAHLAERRRAAG